MSGPCWASILSGFNSTTHGILTNADAESVNRSSAKIRGHLFSFLQETLNRDLNCSVVYAWSGIGGLLQVLTETEKDLTKSCQLIPTKNDEITLNESLRLLTQPDLDALFVYLEDVDNVGHHEGFGIEVDAYIRAIEEADRKVERLLETLSRRAAATSETWLIVLTTDHGGTSKQMMGKEVIEEFRSLGPTVNGQEAKYKGVHGMSTDQHQMVWMVYSVMHGKGMGVPSSPKQEESNKQTFKVGEILPSPRTIDIVPTIIEFFGGRIPGGWKLDGRPLKLFA